MFRICSFLLILYEIVLIINPANVKNMVSS